MNEIVALDIWRRREREKEREREKNAGTPEC